MPSKADYSVRFPDYGVPYSMVRYGSYAEKILYYAKFKNQYFSYEDYIAFRGKPLRPDTYRDCIKRLASYGWLIVDENKRAIVTPEGKKAVRSIAARNSINPKRKRD